MQMKHRSWIYFCIVLNLALVGCQGNTPRPTATLFPRGTIYPLPTLEHIPTVVALPTLLSSSTPQPSATPDYDYGSRAYPVPVSADHTPSSPSPTFTDTPFKLIDQRKLDCTPDGELLRCYDIRLWLKFAYPAEWGEIEATYQHGDTGKEYYYRFSGYAAPWIFGPKAAGRTRDFSAARDGDLTGFPGFEVDEACSFYTGAASCELVRPGLVLAFYYPNADQICRPWDSPYFSAGAVIPIQISEHAVVDTFVFVVPVASEALENEIQRQAELVLGARFENCNQATEARFDIWMKALINAIQNGTGDAQTVRNVEKIYQFIDSIEIK
jgi:hypothetical protein